MFSPLHYKNIILRHATRQLSLHISETFCSPLIYTTGHSFASLISQITPPCLEMKVTTCYFFIISSGSNSLFWLCFSFSSQTLNPTYRTYNPPSIKVCTNSTANVSDNTNSRKKRKGKMIALKKNAEDKQQSCVFWQQWLEKTTCSEAWEVRPGDRLTNTKII
jgi:hypothetical protein